MFDLLRGGPHHSASRRCSALLLHLLVWWCVLLASARAAEQIRDEWEPIDRIVVSTLPDKKLITFVEKIVGVAVKSGVRVVVVDDDAASQAAILARLKSQGLVTDKTESYIQFTNTPHNTGFARDEAAIVRFDTKTGKASVTGTVFNSETSTNQIIKDIGAALRLPTAKVPTVDVPGHVPAPLFGDGGDLMTTDGGKTLITTTRFYEQNGGVSPEIKTAVNAALSEAFGITKVIELEPLDKTAAGYDLSNAHVDLQVRTLPGKRVIVASVPVGDPQRAILDRNAQKLTDAGFQVIRVENAPQAGTKAFKTYTNSLFLNGTIVVPTYGDAARDKAAKEAYDHALNGSLPPNDPRRYAIEQVDASLVILGCGAARCAAREIYRSPSRKEAKEAGSKTPLASFDGATGVLSFTQDVINFLGVPGAASTDPRFIGDPLLGATIEIGDMILHTGMSVGDRFAFVGGSLRLHSGGSDLLKANIPVFTIHGAQPLGALDMFGVLSDIEMVSPGTSAWLDAFALEVVAHPPLLPDFYISSTVDLIGLSRGFTQSFTRLQLAAVGVVGNGSVVTEPSSLPLALLGIALLAGLTFLRSTTGRGPCMTGQTGS